MPLRDIFALDNAPLDDDAARREHIEAALAARPPGGWELDLHYGLVQRWFKPRVYGAEKLPEDPCLFVGNHGLFAIDGLIILPLLLHDYNRFLRPLGDKFLFTEPHIRDFLVRSGAGMGHPEVCSAFMAAKQDILVFPGGAHEAVKSARDSYRLQWKDRYGFVRLAAKHGYTIMPFGLIGPDEFYDHVVEGDELPETLPGKLLGRLGLLGDGTRTDLIPPLTRGTLGTLLPKPQPCFLGFGEPLDLSALRGRRVSKQRLLALRDTVAGQIEAQIAAMLLQREQHRREDGLLRRLLLL
jgi:1-acyl-sn-glycerol-3-phosphate acyltransferase